jgi:AraC-like DNA-binding protein
MITQTSNFGISTHRHDFLVFAAEPSRNIEAITNDRGVRAFRFRAIKADIMENLASPELTVSAVAARQGVTSRYIHMLFTIEGTTFSEFVLGQRLMRAHRMLPDARSRLEHQRHPVRGRV